MKTITASTGKTCKPRHIPNSEKMTADQVQKVYDESADQFEKKIWFDQYILGIARLRKKLLPKATGKILEVALRNGSEFFAVRSQQ